MVLTEYRRCDAGSTNRTCKTDGAERRRTSDVARRPVNVRSSTAFVKRSRYRREKSVEGCERRRSGIAALSPGARVTGNEPCERRRWRSRLDHAFRTAGCAVVGPRRCRGSAGAVRPVCVCVWGRGGRSRAAARSLSPRDRARACKYSVLVYVIIMTSNSLPVFHTEHETTQSTLRSASSTDDARGRVTRRPRSRTSGTRRPSTSDSAAGV